MAQSEKTKVTAQTEKAVIKTLGLNEDILKSFGLVVVIWSSLEHAVYVLLNVILKLEWSLAAMSLIEASFLQKMTMVSSLLHHSRNEEIYFEWEALKKKIDALRTKRNDLVHGFWNEGQTSTPYLLRLKSKGKLVIDKTEIGIEEMRELYMEISISFNDVTDLKRKIEKLPANTFTRPVGPPIDRARSPQAQAQAQARERKKARRLPRQGPKLSEENEKDKDS